MKTLALQSTVTLCLLAFSAFALLTARELFRNGVRGSRQQGWAVTGAIFLICSISRLIQGSWGAAAFFAGPDVRVYSSYLEAAPAFNHSRTFLMFVLYAVLTWICLRKPERGLTLVMLALSPVALILGGLYGYFEGELQSGRHYTATAVIDLGGFLVLALLLVMMLARDTVDRLLWMGLATYGFVSVIGVLFLAAMAWIDTPTAWFPPFWSIELMRLLFVSLMTGFAFAAYRSALSGKQIHSLLPELDQRFTLT